VYAKFVNDEIFPLTADDIKFLTTNNCLYNVNILSQVNEEVNEEDNEENSGDEDEGDDQ